jgi:alpha-beta hydrolase superfamily lysophospholipase
MQRFAAAGYCAYALSLRGHGGSERPRRFRLMTTTDYVSDVAAVVGRLEAPPVLVGHSMGGLVVQKYLEEHPAAGAVLLASNPVTGALRATGRAARRHPLRFLRANLTWSLYPMVETPSMARFMFFSDDTPDDIVAANQAQMQDESYRAYLDLLFRRPRPDRIGAPMLVLAGGRDRLFSIAEEQATARAYGTKVVVFADMAHDLMAEPGWEGVADHIIGWIDRLAIPGG